MPISIRNTSFRIDGSKSSLSMSDGVTAYMGEFVLVENTNQTTPATYNYVDIYNRSCSIQIDPTPQREILLVKSGSVADRVNVQLVSIRMLITSSYFGDPFNEFLDSGLGSQSWTKPDGVTQVLVQCWAGGGAGGGANANNNFGGGGGAGGQYSRKLLIYPSASQIIPYVVGNGAVGSTGDGASGQNTTWDVTKVVALGGAGGFSSTNLGDPGIATDVGATGDVVYRGNSGQTGASLAGPIARGGFGGGGPGSAQNGQGNNGGLDLGGPGGSIVEVLSSGQIGNDGTIYGAGGSGAAKVSGANRAGGSGAQGVVRVFYR